MRRAMTLLFAGGLASACGLAMVGCDSDDDAPRDGGLDTSGGPDASVDLGAAGGCGNVQPCGGDVVGSWTFVEDCESAASVAAIKANFSAMAAGSWCPSQTLVGVQPAASGSISFDAAGGYALALVLGGSLDINFPASCIAGVSCDDATAGFQQQIADGTYPMPNVTAIACTGTSNCVCHETLDRPQTDSGTFSVAGSVLSLVSAAGVPTTKSYCVEGNKLHILKTSSGSGGSGGSAGSPGQVVVDSDLVATKQ